MDKNELDELEKKVGKKSMGEMLRFMNQMLAESGDKRAMILVESDSLNDKEHKILESIVKGTDEYLDLTLNIFKQLNSILEDFINERGI